MLLKASLKKKSPSKSLKVYPEEKNKARQRKLSKSN